MKLADGTEFSVGTGFTDKQRENPPGVGSVITFRYQELSDGGVPRFPSYIGIRTETKMKPQPAKLAGGARRFEFEEGTSHKFWEVSVTGSDLTTHWGKLGTDGQSKTKPFATPEKAQAAMDKLIEEKTGKGYKER